MCSLPFKNRKHFKVVHCADTARTTYIDKLQTCIQVKYIILIRKTFNHHKSYTIIFKFKIIFIKNFINFTLVKR